jgi:hypothetical protein
MNHKGGMSRMHPDDMMSYGGGLFRSRRDRIPETPANFFELYKLIYEGGDKFTRQYFGITFVRLQEKLDSHNLSDVKIMNLNKVHIKDINGIIPTERIDKLIELLLKEKKKSRHYNMSYGGGLGSNLSKGFKALNALNKGLTEAEATLKKTNALVQQGKRISGQAKKITGGGYQSGGKVGYHMMPDGRLMKDSDHHQSGGKINFNTIMSGIKTMSDVVDKTGQVVDKTGRVVNAVNTLVPTKAANVQPRSIVQVKAKDLKQQSTPVQVKQGQIVQVQSLPGNQIVQATREEVRPNAQVLANPQDLKTDIQVQAKPSDLKQSQTVLVDKTAVQPSQQTRVVQVTQDQVLAKPAQLKQGQKIQVPIQNVKGTKQLYQTPQGLSTQKPKEQKGQKGQKGGAASDFVGSFYANTVLGGVPAISSATLSGLETSPMFNPLNMSANFPTMPSTGIVPEGIVMSKM